MPILFISYKRGTSAVAPLMEKLRAAHYRLWFDRDEIYLGDPDWKARIDEGIRQCDGLILNLTPATCESEPVQYEVKRALEMDKPIFPIVLEKLDDWGAALTQVGLTPDHHTEDFTDAEKWSEQIERLLRDLRKQGLRVTPHDIRRERDPSNPNYVLHQAYLKRLAERVGTLNLAQINPDNARGVELEHVYVDSPTGLTISVEVQNWQIVKWGITSRDGKLSRKDATLAEDIGERQWSDLWHTPETLGFETAPFETLVSGIDDAISIYREENPDAKPDAEYSFQNRWRNGAHENVLPLHLNHIAAAQNRLVILGAPGSGKSTFVRYLALCLAGAGIDGWARDIDIASLDNWPHGALTPVYVELRHFVASEHFPVDVKTPTTTDHLWAYICAELLGSELSGYADDLHYDLEHGHAVLILDGLDEVPYPEGKLKNRQNQLISLMHSLNTRYANSRIIVASRPYAYEGWTLPGFSAVTITAFANNHRIALAKRLYHVAGLDEEAALKKAQALNNELRQIDPELKDRPLFVTLMATIYLQGESEGLPTRRGALYRESILLLLDRWTTSKPDAPSLTEILGDNTAADLYNRLAALAYDVHHQYGDQPGTPEIDVGLIFKYLMPLGGISAAKLIPYLSENAGVLVSPGQDAEKDVFHFAHRTFQEYLAAAHIVSKCIKAASFTLIRDHIMNKPQVWRVPCTLAGDVLADTDRRGDLWQLLAELLEDDPPNTANDARWWLVWLAGTISFEQKLHEQTKLNRHIEQPVRDALVERLVALIDTPQALEPVERAACGRSLGLLGDPRPGVGVRDDGVPDIVWSAIIPSDDYPIGGDQEAWSSLSAETYKLTYPYQLSLYPVTNAQFQPFIDADGDGYNNPEYWTEAGLRWKGDRCAPDEYGDMPFRLPNHPRIFVRWYEAMAFCAWLTEKLGFEVRLPTEKEWEIAARGKSGLFYPYGNEFNEAKGNTRETGIGQTSAVGIFPDGAAWCGALDMSGNVWEWCINPYDEVDNGLIDESKSSNAPRALRGGRWGSPQHRARAAYRGHGPSSRYFRSFRVLCAFN